MLNAQTIIAEAEAKAGITDPEPHLHRNLEHLVAALNDDAKLAPSAEDGIRAAIVARTSDRLEGLKWLRDYPEIGEEAIADPVFLTGLPRSGTTFFQYLFDRDPRFRLIRTWESISPTPPPGFDPVSVHRRKAEEKERRARMAPKIEGFEAMHLLDLDGPDECHVFLEQSYAAAGYQNLYDVPSYFDYLMSSLDFGAVYRAHKRQLQLLQWRMERPRWAVKYPNHVLAMDAITQVHPTARFVMTHRDPVQIVASISKLTFTLRGARYAPPVDPHRAGRQMLDFVERHIARILAFCDSEEASRISHVDYYRLVDNPAKVMEEVHADLGIETPENVRAAEPDWHRSNPKNARGANNYTLEEFGLDADALAERFSAYMQRFDIPREKEGLARSP